MVLPCTPEGFDVRQRLIFFLFPDESGSSRRDGSTPTLDWYAFIRGGCFLPFGLRLPPSYYAWIIDCFYSCRIYFSPMWFFGSKCCGLLCFPLSSSLASLFPRFHIVSFVPFYPFHFLPFPSSVPDSILGPSFLSLHFPNGLLFFFPFLSFHLLPFPFSSFPLKPLFSFP